jgi:guanylate kinase
MFSGNQYGASKKTIAGEMAQGLVVVLDIEMHGVKQIKANSSIDARYVFIKPPSLETLERRLRGRGTEIDEDIQKRLAQAKAEVECAETQGVHDKIIVNDDLDKAFKELEEFVYG